MQLVSPSLSHCGDCGTRVRSPVEHAQPEHAQPNIILVLDYKFIMEAAVCKRMPHTQGERHSAEFASEWELCVHKRELSPGQEGRESIATRTVARVRVTGHRSRQLTGR